MQNNFLRKGLKMDIQTLNKLNEMKEKGLLTQDEFDKEKNKILINFSNDSHRPFLNLGMQNIINLSLLVGVIFSLTIPFICRFIDTNKAPSCSEDTDYLKQTLSEWINSAIVKQDKDAKDYIAQIVDVKDFKEYNSSPSLLGTTIYDDYQNSRICKVTAVVKFSGNGLTPSQKEIEMRYQRVFVPEYENNEAQNYIYMSGNDLSDLGEEGVNKLVEILRQ